MKTIFVIIIALLLNAPLAFSAETLRSPDADKAPKQQTQNIECMRSEDRVMREDGIEVAQATCCCPTQDGGMCCGPCGPFSPQGCTFKCAN